MWTVIYVSQSLDTAKGLIDALSEGGIIYKLRRENSEDDNKGCYEVLVPNTELEAAQNLLIELGVF